MTEASSEVMTPAEVAAAPQVENDEGSLLSPANGGDEQRTQLNSSQPSKLQRPLEESARLANIKETDTVLGQDYTVSAADGYRRA